MSQTTHLDAPLYPGHLPPTYPMDRQEPLDPPAELAALRGDAPISRVTVWDGTTPWLVTRHADVRALLADKRLSADMSSPGFPALTPSVAAQRDRPHTASFIRMDDPEHLRLRKMLTREFIVKQAEAMRPGVQATVDRVVDAMLALTPPVDLVHTLALPVPSIVIADLLGVPYARHEEFQAHSHVLVSRTSTPAEVDVARDALNALVTEVARVRFDDPRDDLLSRLVQQRVVTGELEVDDLGPMATLLLVAGHETTANMTALSLLSLLRDRTLWDQLAADESLVPGAVEELLRFHSIVQNGVSRTALEDVEVDGVTIAAGEGVVLSLASANRDEAEFAGPDALDLTRDARHHVAFGFGVHQCLGQPLARVELQVVLETVLRRIPSLRLAAELDELPFRDDMSIYGLHALPVSWDAAATTDEVA